MPKRLQQYLYKKKIPSKIQEQLSIPSQYPYYLSVLAIFKNEGMNIKLWIDHYLWMGVDHFFLIDNNSNDNSQEILKSYVEKGIVSVFFMPEKWKQKEHYQHVYKNHIKKNSKWVIVADLDEFWYVWQSTIRKELIHYEKYDVLLSNWRWFGSDNNIEHPADIRLKNIHRKKNLHRGTKYIFQSQNIKTEQIWLHNVLNHKGKMINVSNIFRLNHYPVQSREYFEKIKMTRGSANCIQHEYVRNEKYFISANEDTDYLDIDLKEMVETQNSRN